MLVTTLSQPSPPSYYHQQYYWIYKIYNDEIVDISRPLYHSLNSCTTLQILFDFFSVLSVVAFNLFIEFHVALVDVIDIRLVVMLTATMEFRTFLNSDKLKKKKQLCYCHCSLVPYKELSKLVIKIS